MSKITRTLIIIFIPFYISACGTMTVVEIPSSEVPTGFWEGETDVYVSDFQLNDPTVAKAKKSGDCSGTKMTSRPYGTPAQNAYCAEARTYDPERQCNVVTSTFGEGYCPIQYSYQSDVNERSLQQMDAVMSAGTAAQNAVLAWGQNMSLQAQNRAREITQKYTLSANIGTSASEENQISVIETISVSDDKSLYPADLVARTREGYYSECIVPYFSTTGKLMSSYYRIVEGQLACELKKDKKGYAPTYINMRTDSKPRTSYIGNLRAKETADTFEICMLDPMMSICSYKKPQLTESKDFEFLRGFVEEAKAPKAAVTINEIKEDSVRINLVVNNDDGVGSLEIVDILFDDSYHNVAGLMIKINELNEDTALLSVKGQFEI